jgi:predicted NAD/FAD-binding protein
MVSVDQIQAKIPLKIAVVGAGIGGLAAAIVSI